MGLRLASSRYVVTGPSGWIGRTLLSRLEENLGAGISAQVTAFASSARDQLLPSGAKLPVRPLETISPADVEGAHLVHLAYLTKEKAEQLGERRFTEGNLAIDDAVLGAMAVAAPASVFVASSGAAALAARGEDLHPYGLTKLRQEARFLDAAACSDVPTIAGRIFNLSGPNINKISSYAISNFVQQAREQGRIRIEATVPVFRSFLHVGDLCAMIDAAARVGIGRDRPVDLCGGKVVEMGELALAIASEVGDGIAIERGQVDCSKPSAYLGKYSETKSMAMCLGIDLVSLQKQISDTVAWLRRPESHDDAYSMEIAS
jgi:nucleoside-diphosphate-sugar epimerase